MTPKDTFRQNFKVKGGDFINAGESSCAIRNILRDLGVNADIIRRVAIAAYEAEMNVVMYAKEGDLRFSVDTQKITLEVEDVGQGIPDITRAMQPGFSTATREMREMGFGAGMGLPNIKKNADLFDIQSTNGKGTIVTITIRLNNNHD